jgi:phenylalanyl-tRNA synthetase alpha chain
MDMVQEALHRNAPDGRFSRKVIDHLLARPRLLEIEGHPIRQIVQSIKRTLADYEVVEGSEVVDTSRATGVDSGIDKVYHVDEDRALRTETTVTTFAAMAGRTPPVRLLTAGRVFRDEQVDANHEQVFHQLDALCIESGVNPQSMQAAVEKAVAAVLPSAQYQWAQADDPHVEHSLDVSIKTGDDWREIAGCGMLTAETLRDAGYDPQTVAGFAFGLGLERITMTVHDLDDIRELWQPPYVTR